MNSSKTGFTLIEVVIAMLLASVVMVTIFGVLSHVSIDVVESDTKSTQARIAQEVVAEILLNDWSSIREYDGELRYFDPEGNPLAVGEGSDSEPDFWAYLVKIEIRSEQAEVPGTEPSESDQVGDDSVVSRRVIVKVTDGYVPDYDFEGKKHRTFPTWVAKTDKL